MPFRMATLKPIHYPSINPDDDGPSTNLVDQTGVTGCQNGLGLVKPLDRVLWVAVGAMDIPESSLEHLGEPHLRQCQPTFSK